MSIIEPEVITSSGGWIQPIGRTPNALEKRGRMTGEHRDEWVLTLSRSPLLVHPEKPATVPVVKPPGHPG